MERALEEVERHCGQDMQRLADCVAEHTETFEQDCMEAKQRLTQCADQNVTVLREMKQRCHQEIDTYEKCLLQSGGVPEVCIEAFTALHRCTHAIVGNSQ